jgi:hypothetical protein
MEKRKEEITEEFLVKTWNEYNDIFQREGYLALQKLRSELEIRIDQNPEYGNVINRYRILVGCLENYERFGTFGNLKIPKKPTNYTGELTEVCIEDLEKLAKLYPDMPINEFFKTAYKQLDTCRKTTNKEDMSWSTLKNRVESLGRDDIYYRKREKRKK